MDNLSDIKSLVLDKMIEQLDEKIDTLHVAILSAKESRNSDTKSSAGDKYETGRAMIQMEIEKNEIQLDKTLKSKHDLSQISYQCTYSLTEFGSLVKTNRGIYFLSIPHGKINVSNTDVYCISMASPIGQAMVGKDEGNEFMFQNNKFVIERIY